jgi:hypothetical protein
MAVPIPIVGFEQRFISLFPPKVSARIEGIFDNWSPENTPARTGRESDALHPSFRMYPQQTIIGTVTGKILFGQPFL